jgi:acetyltransferase-like isoleucine patch superfamily enzyme
MSAIGQAVRSPLRAQRVALELVRGWLCRLGCRLRGVRFEAGKNLRIAGKLVIRGPGTVRFGRNVRVDMTVTPWTYSDDAVIEVGDDAYLNGVSFGCQQRISVGHRAILARCFIMDTDFHSTAINRHDPAAPVRVMPIQIGDNVWIGAAAALLPGTTIGTNSVVGYGAVCSGQLPENSIIAGNPARVVRTINQ